MYIINDEYKQSQYKNLTSFNATYFEHVNRDHNFIFEHSETSDNRPYTTTNVPPDTTPEEKTSSILPQYVRQNTIQLQQDDITHLFQSQELQQLNPLYPQLIQTSDEQPLNPSETTTTHPSETATTQNVSELSQETAQTVQNTQNFTITNDSNLLQVPTHNIIHDETNNQNPDNNLKITQDNISVLSTPHTSVIQPTQTQISPRQNYDPPPLPPQFTTQSNTHNSPQQGSSNVQNTNTVHFQTPTPPTLPNIQTSTYTPAQNNSVQNVQSGLNLNTIHSNPPFNYTTSRQHSRPPLQPILTNPLSYNLTSTNPSHIQQSQTTNNRPNTLNTLSQPPTSNTITPPLQTSQFQIQNPPSTTIRTNPHFHNTSSTSFTNPSNVPTYNTVPPSTVSHNTISHPTYINSSTSISEPIKPFDGLDHNYTPEEYLKHIEARVTFSLSLQTTSEHDYKIWHARRMAFIQCSLPGTALSW